uniref:Transmembrane protein n=1 Tax=Echinococcus granulosus TaxID=6210 RepID=A0A068WPQ2_ECHGR|nr:hypothetical protein EgrG_001113300 [Echinococcus granulosus]
MGTNSITMAQDMLTNPVQRLMIPVVLLNAIILTRCVSFSFCITLSFSVPSTPIDKAKENCIFGRLKSLLFSYFVICARLRIVSQMVAFSTRHIKRGLCAHSKCERAVVASASQG